MTRHDTISVDTQAQGLRKVFDNKHKNVLQSAKTSNALSPVCAHCKKIRDRNGNWQDRREYSGNHFKDKYTHTICPRCAIVLYPDLFAGRHSVLSK
jgi:hypothetical protein